MTPVSSSRIRCLCSAQQSNLLLPSLWDGFPGAAISLSLVQKTTKSCLLGQPRWPESTGLPGAKLSWPNVPSQRIKLLGNVYLAPPWSQDDFIMEIPYSPVRTVSQVEGLRPSDLCGPGGVSGIDYTLRQRGVWGSPHCLIYRIFECPL